MKLSLVVLSEGKAYGQTIPVKLSQFIIGRDPQCHLRPASAVISKRHCALIQRGSKLFVRDFDSTNGTFVNDEQVKGECEVQHEDTLKVGPLAFRVVIEGSVPVNKPTPLPKVVAGEARDDDAVAAMLLDLADENSPSSSVAPGESLDSSTIMEMPATADSKSGEGEGEGEPVAAGRPAEKKPDKKKEMGNTSEAAQAILAKYMRRQR